MDRLIEILTEINGYIWGPPLLIFLILVGLILTFRTRFIQVRHLWYAHKLAFTRHDDSAQGDISHFQSLMTALAATIGIGSITGVATAIVSGGFGALFWMWVAAFFGMATKYAEGILAVKYRVVDEKGQMCGGPMYYLERGLKSKFLAIVFAVLGAITALGTGNLVQSNSVSLAMQEIFHVPLLWSGVALFFLVGIPLIWGIKSIGRLVSILVPAMALFYIVGGLIIVFMKIDMVPHAFGLIFKHAFTPQAATGGFLGATVMKAIQMGISRGIFSSEAGLGTSPIAAAAAKTDSPGRQALVSMSSVFITTVIVCTITGLVIATTDVLGEIGPDGKLLNGSALALRAFDAVIPGGGLIVTIALIPFAYSTILGWAYYGEKCMEYLLGIKAVPFYRILAALIVIPGAILNLEVVWKIADIMNGLMAFPNLVGLFFLTKIVSSETRIFENLLHSERINRQKQNNEA
ncbi:MAG: sodium:alanine symporter family protein [Simkaniaceae bacterium]|nr:sodium:alanine symporter family protein [Simkaniaceae bacterium]MCF7852050.1 sodium:alanine symporter family protein [Simkaniaceae bacterium]